MDESIRNMIMRTKAWEFLTEFLTDCENVIGIKSYEEYCNIVLAIALEISINELATNVLANKVLISYDIYYDEIKEYFNKGEE